MLNLNPDDFPTAPSTENSIRLKAPIGSQPWHYALIFIGATLGMLAIPAIIVVPLLLAAPSVPQAHMSSVSYGKK